MEMLFFRILNLSITASWLILAVLLVRPALKKAPRWISCALWALVGLRLVIPFSLESGVSLIPSAEPILVSPGAAENVSVHLGVPVIDTAVSQVEIPTASVIPAIWVIGTAAMVVYACLAYLRLKRTVAAAIPVGDKLFACDEVPSPFILGTLIPRIYVPSSMGGAALEYVLTHEKAHIARLDHWWKLMGYGILSVHWFNPLCWLAYWLLCRDIEVACDEKAIAGMDAKDKADYAQTLLQCSIPRKMISACPLAFGEVDIKERVKNVLNYRKPALWIILTAVVACVAVGVCFLTNPLSAEEKPIIVPGTYGCEFSGAGGPFTITLTEDGRFSYYEGNLSSHIGVGRWEPDGNQLKLTEGMNNGGLSFYFTVKNDRLLFDKAKSDMFLYCRDLPDQAAFIFGKYADSATIVVFH